MQAEATAEQQWLRRLEGEWRYVSEAEGAPGEPPIRDTGVERVRMLGPWAVLEGQGDADPSPVSIMAVGFDPEKGRFVGTFINASMTFLWTYAGGELEADGTRLVLYAEGPSYTEEGATARYRDTLELRGGDERVMTSHQQLADGTWQAFMTTTYRRIGSRA